MYIEFLEWYSITNAITSITNNYVLASHMTASLFCLYIISIGIQVKLSNTLHYIVPATIEHVYGFYLCDMYFILRCMPQFAAYIPHHIGSMYIGYAALQRKIDWVLVANMFFCIEISNIFVNAYSYSKNKTLLFLTGLTYIPLRTVVLWYYLVLLINDNYTKTNDFILYMLYPALGGMSGWYSLKIARRMRDAFHAPALKAVL